MAGLVADVFTTIPEGILVIAAPPLLLAHAFFFVSGMIYNA